VTASCLVTAIKKANGVTISGNAGLAFGFQCTFAIVNPNSNSTLYQAES